MIAPFWLRIAALKYAAMVIFPAFTQPFTQPFVQAFVQAFVQPAFGGVPGHVGQCRG